MARQGGNVRAPSFIIILERHTLLCPGTGMLDPTPLPKYCAQWAPASQECCFVTPSHAHPQMDHDAARVRTLYEVAAPAWALPNDARHCAVAPASPELRDMDTPIS